MTNKKQIWTIAGFAALAGALYETLGSIIPAIGVMMIGAYLVYKFKETPLNYTPQFKNGEDSRAIRNTGRGSTFISPNPTVETVRNGYHELVNIIQHDGDQKTLHDIIENYELLEPINPEKVFLELSNEFNKITPHFIMSLDWKAGVSDLNWHIGAALKGVKNVKLPNSDLYPDDASILYGLNFSNPGDGLSKVFDDYLEILNKAGYGICFIDNKGDYFSLALYRLQDRQEVIDAVFNSGLAIGSGL